MEKEMFCEYCMEKFNYLINEFSFNKCFEDGDFIKPSIIYEKKGIKVKINNSVIESPHEPISMRIIITTGKIFKKSHTYDFDDVLTYRKCTSKVYDHLDYTNIDSFYELIPEERLVIYEDKYSREEEIKLLIDKYARLLKEYGYDILQDDFRVLADAEKLRIEYDEKYECGSHII